MPPVRIIASHNLPPKRKKNTSLKTKKNLPETPDKSTPSVKLTTTPSPPTIGKILITQAKPTGTKSPYFDLQKKTGIEFDFYPFIRIEPIGYKEFKKQKINILEYTAIIFTSKFAIENFFRICDELKLEIKPTLKFFCVSETIALYLQKFTQYRKRKVFFSIDGTNNGLFETIEALKLQENFLYVCSENQQDNEILTWLNKTKAKFNIGFFYRTISNDVKQILQNQYDIICFFTPSGIKSLFDSFPRFKQKYILIGVFGNNTFKCAEKLGLKVAIRAPKKGYTSMVSVLHHFLLKQPRQPPPTFPH